MRRIILHNYRRCPYCIRVRVVLYLKNLDYELVEEPFRVWTPWMQEHIPNPCVPILRIDDEIQRESNDINLRLDTQFGEPILTPEEGSVEYQEMRYWWNWCDTDLKPKIDLWKYGKDRIFDHNQNILDEQNLRKSLEVLEARLISQPNLVSTELTLADIAIIPFVRQIMRTRNGIFDWKDFRQIIRWSDQILGQDWFDDVVMTKHK